MHNKIVMLAKSKLNNTETMVSQLLIHFEIGQEEYTTMIYEEK